MPVKPVGRKPRTVVSVNVCKWCGDEIPEDMTNRGETYFDADENEYDSELCLGQAERSEGI